MTNLLNIPAVSVILPVYNAAGTVEQSVRSILGQTFRDFELIIIDDGSTDRSADVINAIDDGRIIFLRQRNIGLAATLNKAISLARAPLIARQDNDDISYPSRLQKQVDYLKEHPEVVVVGTAARIVDANLAETGRWHRHACQPDELKYNLLFENPFVHSTVMFRKSAWAAAAGYSTSKDIFEDYDLWSRMSGAGKLANLNEVLLDYRESPAGMSKTSGDYEDRVRRTSLENISFLLPEKNKELIRRFAAGSLPAKEYRAFLDELSAAAARQWNLQGKVVENLKSRRFALYLRQLYNEQLNDENSGAWTRMRARVLRYLLFRKQNWT